MIYTRLSSFIDFHAILDNYTKRLKVQGKKTEYSSYTLNSICDWLALNQPAIEYHDLEEIKIISYNELQVAKEIISKCLRSMQYPEFVGIDLDILEYCVPSLMLG